MSSGQVPNPLPSCTAAWGHVDETSSLQKWLPANHPPARHPRRVNLNYEGLPTFLQDYSAGGGVGAIHTAKRESQELRHPAQVGPPPPL